MTIRKILLATTFMIYFGISFSQNSITTKEINNDLLGQNFSLTALNHSQVNLFSKNARSGFFDWKERWNTHSTRKIIIGSICILLGADGMVEAFLPRTDYESPSSRRIRQIQMASISTMLLSSGTVLLIRGIHLKRQNKIQVTTSINGIGLIYRI
jgi:hypothetical protein